MRAYQAVARRRWFPCPSGGGVFAHKAPSRAGPMRLPLHADQAGAWREYRQQRRRPMPDAGTHIEDPPGPLQPKAASDKP